MPIVSISINDDLLGEMEVLKRELGYTGKSELVRAAIRTLIAEKRERENLVGQVSSILIASHNEDAEEVVTGLKHRYERCINTHLHSKQERKMPGTVHSEGRGVGCQTHAQRVPEEPEDRLRQTRAVVALRGS